MNKIMIAAVSFCWVALAAVDNGEAAEVLADLETTARDVDAIKTITKLDDFNAKIKSGGFSVVKFHAPWCPYCVKMDPIFKAIAEKYTDRYSFYEVNYDNAPEICKKNGIRSIPVFRFYDATGNKVGEISSYRDAATFEKEMNAFFGKK